MKPLHYYSIRVTTPTGNCSEMGLRKLARAILDEVEAL